jgi:hypothetical protein
MRWFQLQGNHLDTHFVEVGTEPVHVTYGARGETSGYKTLSAAFSELLRNDPKAEERLEGKQ